VVASTAPLLQRWLAGTTHRAAADPYFLYRASNVGSIAGLLAYPLVVERTLGLAEQGRVWGVAYTVLVVLLVACAVATWRAARTGTAQGAEEVPDPDVPGATAGDEADADAADRPTLNRRLRWLVLSFVPSTFLLGSTAFLTTDIAPVPLLWVVPLSLYLLTFVIAFSPGERPRLLRVVSLALPVAMVLLAVSLVIGMQRPLWVLLLVHLGGLFVVAMALHGELARDRPPARHLTSFYLWVAAGGALGGVFNALLAPVLFDSFLEYPLAIVLACLLRPTRLLRDDGFSRALDISLPLMLGLFVSIFLFGLRSAGSEAAQLGATIVLGFSAGLLINFGRRPVRLGLGVAAFMLAGAFAFGAADETLEQGRNFFGVREVVRREVPSERAVQHRLVNGTTLHGTQYQDRKRRLVPVSYYHPTGPLGRLVGGLPDRRLLARTGVIGLGAGAMACHAREGDHFTFYEVDPAVERIARDPRLFTYLRDCPGEHEVVLGDARLSIDRDPGRRFGFIVADAFTSDAIPVHLLTREALDLYLERLDPRGVIAVNVSNRYLELERVLGTLAADRGLACFVGFEDEAAVEGVPGKVPSSWVALARRSEDLGVPSRDPRRWKRCPPQQGAAPWTDDYSNIISLFRWR
ncbi:MAG: fused MFS/spermidine synthase, partial [Thermoleophilaceae bacterium]